MTCKLVFNVVTVGPNGAGRSIVQCTTHGMTDFALVCAEGDLCPVGKIEKATEAAIQQIEAAKVV